MIAWLLARSPLVRNLIIGVTLLGLFVIAFTVWRSMDRQDAVRDDRAKVEAKVSPARETAARERVVDTVTINAREKELTHAVQSLPDARPSPRRIALACQRLRQQGTAEPDLPTDCRPPG